MKFLYKLLCACNSPSELIELVESTQEKKNKEEYVVSSGYCTLSMLSTRVDSVDKMYVLSSVLLNLKTGIAVTDLELELAICIIEEKPIEDLDIKIKNREILTIPNEALFNAYQQNKNAGLELHELIKKRNKLYQELVRKLEEPQVKEAIDKMTKKINLV